MSPLPPPHDARPVDSIAASPVDASLDPPIDPLDTAVGGPAPVTPPVTQPGRDRASAHPTHRAVPPTDPAHFRHCLGRFATGVTVVATRDSDGRYVGLTANSFNSLSLDPPLILWSLSAQASSLAVFKRQRHFSISVLSVEQVGLARQFASRVVDRFDGVAVHEGLDGVPLIDGAVGWFECERRSQSLHGDHWLFVGEVRRCAGAEGSPLVFRHGEFATAGRLDEPVVADDVEPGQGPFYEEYLPYLLLRAGHQVADDFHRRLRDHGLSMLGWRVLAALSTRPEWTVGELAQVSLAKQPTVSKLIDRLAGQGMVVRRADPDDARRVRVALSARGRETITPVLEEASAFNLALLSEYPPESLTALKRVLRDMIARAPARD